MKNVTLIKRKAKPLKKEKDTGFIEYKWKLVNIERNRLIRLITQMNYRLNEGNGRSMYAIGFSDDGCALGITNIEMKSTLNNIYSAVEELGAEIIKTLLFTENESYWAKIFIRKTITIDYF